MLSDVYTEYDPRLLWRRFVSRNDRVVPRLFANPFAFVFSDSVRSVDRGSPVLVFSLAGWGLGVTAFLFCVGKQDYGRLAEPRGRSADHVRFRSHSVFLVRSICVRPPMHPPMPWN